MGWVYINFRIDSYSWNIVLIIFSYFQAKALDMIINISVYICIFLPSISWAGLYSPLMNDFLEKNFDINEVFKSWVWIFSSGFFRTGTNLQNDHWVTIQTSGSNHGFRGLWTTRSGRQFPILMRRANWSGWSLDPCMDE